MADLNISKPSPGQQITLTPQPESNLVFDFSVANVSIARREHSLIFTFEDGAQIVLADFYTVYSAENMPSFLIDGENIDGKSFFAALGEDLMPALGNASVGAQGSGSSVDTIKGVLIDGLSRMGRLDQENESSDDESFDDDNFGLPVATATAPVGGVASALGGDDSINQPAIDNTPNDSTDQPEEDNVPTVPEELNNIPEADDANVVVVESGVGRDDDASLTDAPNQEFDGKLSVTGAIVAIDSDGDTLNYEIVGTGKGNYGSIVMDSETGEFTYVLDDTASQSLGQGDKVQERFEVEVSDGKGGTTIATVTVTVLGTNDAPSLSVESLSIIEDRSMSATGTLEAFDADDNAELSFFVVRGDVGEHDNETASGLDTSGLTKEGVFLQGEYGSFIIEADGTYTYNADSDAIKNLEDGQFVEESFTIYVQDDKGAWKSEVVTVTINGASDPESPAPPEVSDTSVDVVEHGVADDANTEAFDANADFVGKPSATGTIVATDAVEYTIKDGTEDGKEGIYGKLTIENNEYTYTLNQGEGSAANSLAAGETRTEKFTIRVEASDGTFTEHEITVTVTGTNDKPTFSLESVPLVVTEDVDVDMNGNIVASGTAHGTDVDNGAELSYGLDAPTSKDDVLSTSQTGKYGTFSIDPVSGEYTYTVDNDSVQHLGLDENGKPESVTESFDIYVRDEHGAYSKQTITVTVNGANDVPEIVNPKDPTPDTPDMPGTVTKTDLSTSDENLGDEATSATDSGQIIFTSDETMHGGKVTIGDTTFAVVKNPDGSYSLSPSADDDFSVENDAGFGNLTVNENLAYNKETGEFTLSYTYEQTKNYTHDNSVFGGNVHDQVQENAESFDVFIQDGKEANNSQEGLQVTINVDISDDGPAIIEKDLDGEGVQGESTAVLDGTTAKTELEIDFGGDGPGQILLNTGATYKVGVEWVDNSWQVIVIDKNFFPNAPVVTYVYDKEANEHILKMGDVTLKSYDNENWIVSYEVNPEGRDPVGLTFVDGDGDSVKHTINSPTPEKPETPEVPEVPETPEKPETPIPPVNPDINSLGDFIDNVTIYDSTPHVEGGLQTNWQGSYATSVVRPGLTPADNERDDYSKDGYIVDVGVANDVVQMGKYNDIIYLGEGHVESQDIHENTAALEKLAQESMEKFMFGMNTDGSLREDSSIVNAAYDEDSALAQDITAMSQAYVDMAHGGGGNDVIYGEAGVDLIYGGSGNDLIYGGEGNDGLRGGGGDDCLYGGCGNDVMYGGLGSDLFDGGCGDDFIIADVNDAMILGGLGNDLIKVDLSTLGDLATDALHIDGGDNDEICVDILLAGVNGLDAAKEMISNGTIENIEIIIGGGNVEGKNVTEVLENLNIKAGESFNPSEKGWTASASQDLSKMGYTEFSKEIGSEEITILIQTSLITA